MKGNTKLAPESLVVEIGGGYRVYVEHHRVNESFETVILVNGALATTASFGPTVKYLRAGFNVVLYDLPYAGRSRPHNPDAPLLGKDEEVRILLTLIERFRVQHVISISWGGVAALLALAQAPAGVRKAVIGSFSPVLNRPMLDYLDRADECLDRDDRCGAASLLNHTVGQQLPRLLKLYNHRYLSTLAQHEYAQIAFHIAQIRQLDAQRYVDRFSAIRVPVLFVNGELDAYTSARDVLALGRHIRHSRFATIPGAGHFLDVEGREALRRVSAEVLDFLGAPRPEPFAPALSEALALA